MPKTYEDLQEEFNHLRTRDELDLFENLNWYSESEFNEERFAKERFHKLAFDKEHECEKLKCKIEEMTKLI